MIQEKLVLSSLQFWKKIWLTLQPVHSEGDQPWDFFGRNDAKAEAPVLWPRHAKRWLIGKDSDARRDWGQEKKGTTQDEMAGWHHWLDERESQWTPGVGDGQGGLACCGSWGHKESDTTERLNWTECPFLAELAGGHFSFRSIVASFSSPSNCHGQSKRSRWPWRGKPEQSLGPFARAKYYPPLKGTGAPWRNDWF